MLLVLNSIRLRRLMTAAMFSSEHGQTVPAITADQVREVDRVAIEETGPNLYQMMENAGRLLPLAVIDVLGSEGASTPITVLAGTGGNGGGGICAARHLANRGQMSRSYAQIPAAWHRSRANSFSYIEGPLAG
jgi:NAD(P)H-hydrate repair Nnr-like enzyme with NAD(P)H-hydrate epimerase domain